MNWAANKARWRRNGAAAAIAICLAAVCEFGMAQAASSVGTTFTSVALTGTVDLSPQVSLRLPGTVTLDLRDIPGDEEVPECVIGPTSGDPSISAAALGSSAVAPAGITFGIGVFPAIQVSGGAPTPPNKVLPAARNIVCYKSFVVRAFGNMPGWQLTVDRLNVAVDQPIENLFVGAACATDDGVSMYRLGTDMSATLVTSAAAGGCRDVAMVLAVKPGHEKGGTSVAHLRYTLMAHGDEFGGVR